MINGLKLIVVLLTLCSASVYSQSSYHSMYGNKNIPLVIEAIVSSVQTRDFISKKHDGLYSKFGVAATYSVTEKNDLRVFASAIYEVFDGSYKEYVGADSLFKLDLTEFMYRRNSILNSKDHGVNLDIELKNYYFLDEDIRQRYGFDGAFIPQLVFKKKFSHRFVTEFKLRRHFYFKNNGSDATLHAENRLYLTPTYVFTRSLFFSTQFKYKNKVRGGRYFSRRSHQLEPEATDEVYMRPSLLFLVNNSTLIEGYWESKIAQSHDGQTFAENWQGKGVFGASAYITAF